MQTHIPDKIFSHFELNIIIITSCSNHIVIIVILCPKQEGFELNMHTHLSDLIFSQFQLNITPSSSVSPRHAYYTYG